MVSRNPKWRQDNPHDQLTALLMSLEGTVGNVVEGISRPNKLIPIVRELKRLKPFLKDREWPKI